MAKVCAVIPAFNEERTIAKVVRGVRKYVDEVFVIDDSSDDRTVEMAKEAGAKVVRHKINRGVGAAQRTGYRIALMEGYDIVVQIDADGQHNPDFVPVMVDKVLGGADIVIASRFMNESYRNYSFTRRAGIIFFTKFVSVFGGVEITDVTSGFRAYSRKALEVLGRLPDRNWAVEQTLEAALKGLKIEEISAEMPPRKIGKSQFNLETFLKYPLRALESFLRVLIFRR